MNAPNDSATDATDACSSSSASASAQNGAQRASAPPPITAPPLVTASATSPSSWMSDGSGVSLRHQSPASCFCTARFKLNPMSGYLSAFTPATASCAATRAATSSCCLRRASSASEPSSSLRLTCSGSLKERREADLRSGGANIALDLSPRTGDAGGDADDTEEEEEEEESSPRARCCGLCSSSQRRLPCGTADPRRDLRPGPAVGEYTPPPALSVALRCGASSARIEGSHSASSDEMRSRGVSAAAGSPPGSTRRASGRPASAAPSPDARATSPDPDPGVSTQLWLSGEVSSRPGVAARTPRPGVAAAGGTGLSCPTHPRSAAPTDGAARRSGGYADGGAEGGGGQIADYLLSKLAKDKVRNAAGKLPVDMAHNSLAGRS